MKRNTADRLKDILESIEKIEQYITNVTEKEFYRNEEKQDSIIRRIEIIGEAAGSIPEQFKNKHTKIPWRDITDMRNCVIHDYPGVNLRIVWEVVKKDIPKLKKKILLLYEKEKSKGVSFEF